MKYASGLSYKVLKAVADRGAVGSLTRGYAREVGGHWQFVLNYTVPDPSTNRGTRQHRITKNFPELASCGRRARAKDGVERKELPVWREQVIADVKSIANTGSTLDPENSVRKTVEDWVAWAERRASKPIRKSTASNYRQIAKRIFRYPLAELQMLDLNTNLVQRMIDDLARDKGDRRGLSHKSLKDTLSLLNTVCVACLGKKGNPCGKVTLPDGRVTRREKAGQLNILSEAEVARVMAILDQLDTNGFDAMSLAARISFSVALRAEEVTALTWADVDLEGGIVSVTHVIERVEEVVVDSNGMPVRDDNGNIRTSYVELDTAKEYARASRQTKSVTSRRSLEIAPEVVEMLRRRCAEVAAEIEALPREERPNIDGLYVLGGADGSFLSPRSLCRRWRRFAKSRQIYGCNGYPLSFHGIRHTVGSRLAPEVNISVLSRWLGHSSVLTTERYYVHLDQAALHAASVVASNLVSLRPGTENTLSKQEGLIAV